MKTVSMFGMAACGLAVAALMPVTVHGQDRVSPSDRLSSSEKGSLVIFSKVEVRETANPGVVMDTFLTLTNDYNEDVKVQLYMVNGDSWTNVDTEITLTRNQPIFWSARTGQPAGGGVGSGNVSPFGSAGPFVVDPATGDLVWRGYVLAWAVDSDNEPIRWNHLAGNAMLVDYRANMAWEYNAWASQVTDSVEHGARVSQDSGTINMNGVEYTQAYEQLLYNFYAPGAILSSGIGGPATTILNGSLTLHLVDADLRQDGNVRKTKADIDIWNMNETKFSNTRRCIICWDQTPLHVYTINAIFGIDPPNNFLLANLQTRAGKARIEGNASTDCDTPGFLSESLPLLGVQAKFMSISGAREAAGSNLVGMGYEDATILYDALGGSPPEQIVNELKRPGAADAPRRGR